MFYTDDAGMNVIQFGTGDIEISPGIVDEPKETIGCISLIPQKEMPIGSIRERGVVDPDNCTKANVHTRLEFYKTESIDVMIQQLKRCKSIMLRDLQ